MKKYRSPVDFRISLQKKLQDIALTENKDIQDTMKKVAFDRFLARFFEDQKSPWYLKGGYALELQFMESRATKDIDLVLKLQNQDVNNDNIAEKFIENQLIIYAEKDLEDYFTFKYLGKGKSLNSTPYGGMRFDFESKIADKRFVSFHVDVSLNDIRLDPLYKLLTSRDWVGYAGIDPVEIKLLAAEEILAEKIHAYTIPRDRENSRVRDLVDMIMLIKQNAVDPEKLKTCIYNVFKRRGTHEVPEALPRPPESWNSRFPTLARSCAIEESLEKGYSEADIFFKENKIFERN